MILHPSSSDPDYQKRGLLIDTTKTDPDSGKWIATWIPVVQTLWNPDETPTTCYGRDINNNGDLVGVYRSDVIGTNYGAFIYSTGLYDGLAPSTPIVLPFTLQSPVVKINNPIANRPSQIVGGLEDASGTVFRYTPGAQTALETFPALSGTGAIAYAINGHGEFCGRFIPPRISFPMPYRFDPDAETSPTVLGNKQEHANLIGNDINNASDVAASAFPQNVSVPSHGGRLQPQRSRDWY